MTISNKQSNAQKVNNEGTSLFLEITGQELWKKIGNVSPSWEFGSAEEETHSQDSYKLAKGDYTVFLHKHSEDSALTTAVRTKGMLGEGSKGHVGAILQDLRNSIKAIGLNAQLFDSDPMNEDKERAHLPKPE